MPPTLADQDGLWRVFRRGIGGAMNGRGAARRWTELPKAIVRDARTSPTTAPRRPRDKRGRPPWRRYRRCCGCRRSSPLQVERHGRARGQEQALPAITDRPLQANSSPAGRRSPSRGSHIRCQVPSDAAVLGRRWHRRRHCGRRAPALTCRTAEANAYKPTVTLRPRQPLQRRQQARDDLRMSFLQRR
jgi:hypothetical protein